MGDSAWIKAGTLPPLRTLHDGKISIIDWTAPPKVFATGPSGGVNGEPNYAIEDFGSDYEGGEEQEEDEEDEM
jgi:hypothetical protein